MEQNSQQLIREQLEVNDILVQETAHLKRKFTEAREGTEAQCVICRDAKPSQAFVPCGHVCACSACWDVFAQTGGRKCPNCRRDVEFSFSHFPCSLSLLQWTYVCMCSRSINDIWLCLKMGYTNWGRFGGIADQI